MIEFVARDYQNDGIQACVDILTSPKKNCREIVIAPTAAGKSWYTAETVRRVNSPIIIIQPSRELLLQNYEKYLAVGGAATICCASLKTKTIKGEPYTEIEDGSFVRCRELSKVTFCTVGTVIKHIEELKKLGVKKILVDECHMLTQSTTQNVGGRTKEKPAQIKKLMKLIGATHMCGLTATSLYLQGGMNGASLKIMTRVRWKLFTNIRHVTQISHLVENGYWSKLKYQINKTDETVLEHNKSGSDYTVESLKKYYTANNLKDQIIEEIENLKKEGRKSIMVFLSSIEEAEELYKAVPNSAIVHSDIDLKTRAYFVREFKALRIPVIFNINCLATGFDHQLVDGLITVRPTSSISVYYQQIGRGVRIHKDKKDCKVVDFSGNVLKFGKVEELYYEDVKHYGWGLFNGRGELLTDFPIAAKNRPTKQSLIESAERKLSQEKAKKENKPYNSVGKENIEISFGKFKGKKFWDLTKDPKQATRFKSYVSWLYDEYKIGKWKFYGQEGLKLKHNIEEYLQLPVGKTATVQPKKDKYSNSEVISLF